jgi:DNA-binding NtrC family response regulator
MGRHHWPGNIRELENVVKRFVILQDEALLRFDMEPAGSAGAAEASQPFVDDGPPHVPASPHHDAAASSLPELARAAMLQAERDLIIPTLHRVHWNRRKAAPLLGISYKTLLNKIKEHGIIQE